METFSMKELLFTLCIIAFSGATFGQRAVEDCLPKEVSSSISLGMSFNEFKRKKDIKDLNHTNEGFRHIYEEKINSRKISSIVYYFDADNDMPLYEVIFVYNDKTKCDAAAKKLLGEPNYKENEWKYIQEQGVPLYSWIFKNKLILMQPLKDTEWDGDENL